MIYGFPIIAALLIFGLAWRLLLTPLANVNKSMSEALREKAIPDVVRTTTLFATLSGGAVVLTVSVLQLWHGNDIRHAMLVIFSWGGFVSATLLGSLALIALYVYRLHYLAVTAEMVRGESATEREMRATALGRAGDLIGTNQRIEMWIFGMICLQLLSFTLGVFYLFAFASINLLPI